MCFGFHVTCGAQTYAVGVGEGVLETCRGPCLDTRVKVSRLALLSLNFSFLEAWLSQ